jgi:hypothetical protein
MFCRRAFRPSTRTSSVILHPSIWRDSIKDRRRFDEIIGEEIEKELRTGRKQVCMFYAIEHLQHIKVILQNKLTIRRSEISQQLIECINTPVRSHKQGMQYRERWNFLSA